MNACTRTHTLTLSITHTHTRTRAHEQEQSDGSRKGEVMYLTVDGKDVAIFQTVTYPNGKESTVIVCFCFFNEAPRLRMRSLRPLQRV